MSDNKTLDLTVPVSNSTDSVAVVNNRQWNQEPDGPYDREIEIWYNQNWVPAFISDVLANDFFLDTKMPKIEDNQCWLALTNVRKSKDRDGHSSFVIRNVQVVGRAPETKDVTPIPLTHTEVLKIK